MSAVYTEWQEWIENEPPDRQQAFYDAYYEREAEVYPVVLEELIAGELFRGTLEEAAAHYGLTPTLFAVFLDGINTSLAEPVDLENLEETTFIDWEIVPETLFYNMVDVKADWLRDLPQWDGLLSAEERNRILREWRYNSQAHAERKPGRNDPCPCGSGKKYKKCCMLKEAAAETSAS